MKEAVGEEEPSPLLSYISHCIHQRVVFIVKSRNGH